MVSFGILAGPSMPAHDAIGNFGKPASTIEGTSGSSGLRSGSVVTSGRSLPSRSCGATVAYELIIIWTVPESRSVIASGSLL